MKDDLISRTELLKEFEKRQKQLDMHGRGFSDCFVNAGQELSAEWWAVENIVENFPSAQPDVPDTNVGDMISRQAAIDVCRNPEDGEDTYACGDDIQERLRSLPSAQQWIPVSERLPNENEDVLVWVYDRAEVGCYDLMYTGEVMWTFEGFCVYGDELDSVEAWMPMPERYKGDV